MAARQGYTAVQIGLHWIIAALIVVNWFTGEGMGAVLRERLAAGQTGITGNTAHVWIGGAVFALVLVRIVVRRLAGDPGHAAGTSATMAAAAIWGHRIIYALMVLVPLSGALTWYGGLPLGDGHAALSNLLVLVALGHAVVAIAHTVSGRPVLDRMLRPR